MVEAFSPKLTPFELLKTRLDRLLLVDPAETLMFVRPPTPPAAAGTIRPRLSPRGI